MRPTAYNAPPMTYAPGLAMFSTPVDTSLRNAVFDGF